MASDMLRNKLATADEAKKAKRVLVLDEILTTEETYTFSLALLGVPACSAPLNRLGSSCAYCASPGVVFGRYGVCGRDPRKGASVRAGEIADQGLAVEPA